MRLRQPSSTFIRFILVGLLNTAFGCSIFALLIFIGLHYSLAVLLATILGVLFNFKTIGGLVFYNTSSHLIAKFISTYIAVYFVNIVLIKLLLSVGINIYISGGFATIVSALISYILNAEWVFKEKRYEIN